jgi:hypothetical protein
MAQGHEFLSPPAHARRPVVEGRYAQQGERQRRPSAVYASMSRAGDRPWLGFFSSSSVPYGVLNAGFEDRRHDLLQGVHRELRPRPGLADDDQLVVGERLVALPDLQSRGFDVCEVGQVARRSRHQTSHPTGLCSRKTCVFAGLAR